MTALAQNPHVALTIDTETFPHKVLQIRGTARLETVEGVVPEYAASAQRYFGEEQGQAWVRQLPASMVMTRMTLRPEWVGVLDFQTRLPSAIS